MALRAAACAIVTTSVAPSRRDAHRRVGRCPWFVRQQAGAQAPRSRITRPATTAPSCTRIDAVGAQQLAAPVPARPPGHRGGRPRCCTWKATLGPLENITRTSADLT